MERNNFFSQMTMYMQKRQCKEDHALSFHEHISENIAYIHHIPYILA